MTSQVSKDAFAAKFNLSAQSGQLDSTITGSTTNFSAELVLILLISQTLRIMEK